ncbi:hypothetical protein J437_LFUL007488 [Ladona fulva]|uniref:Integrase catalytic domain-containing protein n=1 Tax=Ladona fulva TaxID=123851 RepID=A0A8K0KFN3_LADFU|nr:hypothetical protein J437_LFUL007488 [Ladona fulva]
MTGLKNVKHTKRIVANNLRYLYTHGIPLSGHRNIFMWILQVNFKRNDGSFWWMHIPNGLKYEVPRQLVTNNETSFTSEEICKYCEFNGVKHIRTIPYHPKTNGLTERFGDTGEQDLRLQQLLSYRNTPHSTTGKAPAELFLGHSLPTWWDCLKPDPRNKMEIKMWKQKVYEEANVRAHSFRQGDEVWVQNKCKPGWHPGVVGRKTGKLLYEVLIGGQMKRKHADQLHSRSEAR